MILFQQSLNIKEDIRAALFELDDFCKANGIEYMVTGTVALAILGIPFKHEPSDIDIKVTELSKEQEKKLKELQSLTCYETKVKGYTDSCYTFYVKGIRVNVIVDTEGQLYMDSIILRVADIKNNVERFMRVQQVRLALKDKMKLNRFKDKDYMLDLIAYLASL